MNQSEIVLYKTEDGAVKIDALLQNETIWLTQNSMGELFGVNVPAISKHLKNIFEEGELQKEATLSKMETVQNEGGRQIKRSKEFYNLDAVIYQFENTIYYNRRNLNKRISHTMNISAYRLAKDTNAPDA